MYDFSIEFNYEDKTPKYEQLYKYIKDEIFNGHFSSGSKLPSTRSLSRHLGVSRNTIDSAYGQLLAEGYLVSKEKSGYYIADDISSYTLSNLENEEEIGEFIEIEEEKDEAVITYDFKYGQIDEKNFPLSIWKRSINQWMASLEFKTMNYGHKQGELSLRKELAFYIRNARGVRCSPEQIILTSGTQMSLDLICKLLKDDYKSVAVEDPGYIGARDIFKSNEYELIPIGLDLAGMEIVKLEESSSNLALVTPSHQFPYGMIMPISRRLELLNWADKNDGIIIENDYEGEFSYIKNPVPSLKSHDEKDRVIYLYNFSSSLLPSVRTSFFVLPVQLLKKYKKLFINLEQTVPILEQKAIEDFIAKGAWERHIRKMKNIYARKFVDLSEAVKKHLGDRVEIIGNKAGLHILLRVKTDYTEDMLIKKAEKVGVGVYPTSKYWLGSSDEKYPLILLGFGGMEVYEFDKAISLLAETWFK